MLSTFLPPPRSIPENLNLEGMTSVIRIAMLPFSAEGTKISLNEEALQLDSTHILSSVTRKWTKSSYIQMIVIKKIVRIMLDLFPLKFLDQKVEEEDPLTKIYQKMVAGLKHFDCLNFIPRKPNEPPYEANASDFDYSHALDFPPNANTVTIAVRQAIYVLEYSLKHPISPKQNLEPLQHRVKQSYDTKLLGIFADLLDTLEKCANEPAVTSLYFQSLYNMTDASLEIYRKNQRELTTLHTSNRKENPSPPAEQI